jgi:hypothetical protein
MYEIQLNIDIEQYQLDHIVNRVDKSLSLNFIFDHNHVFKMLILSKNPTWLHILYRTWQK